MKKSLFVAFLGILLILSLPACGSSSASTPTTSLKVDMQEFSFAPESYVVPAGQEITIELINSGAIEHDFTIMRLGAKVTLPFGEDDKENVYWEAKVKAGTSATLSFTAPTEPGEYQIVCGLGGHFEAGMSGVLKVVSP